MHFEFAYLYFVLFRFFFGGGAGGGVLRVLCQGSNQSARILFIRAFSGCYAILTTPEEGETAAYGCNPALFWVLSVSCWFLAEFIFTQFDQHCSFLLAEFNMSTISTFIRSRSSLINHSRFQRKIYTRFQTKKVQKPYSLGRHIPIWLLKLLDLSRGDE